MKNIQFHSESDLSSGYYLSKIVDAIKSGQLEDEWNHTTLIDFFNTLKYLQVERFKHHIQAETDVNMDQYTRSIKSKIGKYIGVNKTNFLIPLDGLSWDQLDSLLEIIEKYKVYKHYSSEKIIEFVESCKMHISSVLNYKEITEYCDQSIKDVILNDPMNAETVISKFLDDRDLNLPHSLDHNEILSLIEDYINAERPNLNYLRRIVNFPANCTLKITDKIKLYAKRRAKKEEDKLFNDGSGMKRGVSISYPEDQQERIIESINGADIDIKVSRTWIEENLDFQMVWYNFIHLFKFLDDFGRISLVSKSSEMGVLENVIREKGEHIYPESFAFSIKEMKTNLIVYTYTQILSLSNVRIEDMIEWFFTEYIRNEFGVENFIVVMPTENSTYFEKCRSILPEIDRIFKQYSMLISDGSIDHELLQMSSSSLRFNEVDSLVENKYVYPNSEWFSTASYLIFSDQSGIFYMPSNEEKYSNFAQLIISENLTKNDFQEYQLHRIQWLFDQGLIFVNDSDHIKFVNLRRILMIKELYYDDVLNYWHYSDESRLEIDELYKEGHLVFENKLLTKGEDDYLNYYLNKSKFTNGYDIRNRYMHGTNSNDEQQYMNDYFMILKLFVIIILRINDDLCLAYNLDESDIVE